MSNPHVVPALEQTLFGHGRLSRFVFGEHLETSRISPLIDSAHPLCSQILKQLPRQEMSSRNIPFHIELEVLKRHIEHRRGYYPILFVRYADWIVSEDILAHAMYERGAALAPSLQMNLNYTINFLLKENFEELFAELMGAFTLKYQQAKNVRFVSERRRTIYTPLARGETVQEIFVGRDPLP